MCGSLYSYIPQCITSRSYGTVKLYMISQKRFVSMGLSTSCVMKSLVSMAQCNITVTQLLTHWSYCTVALNHQFSSFGATNTEKPILHEYISFINPHNWDLWRESWVYIHKEIIESVSNNRTIAGGFIIIYEFNSWFGDFTLSLVRLSSKYYEDHVYLQRSWVDDVSFLVIWAGSEAYSYNFYT